MNADGFAASSRTPDAMEVLTRSAGFERVLSIVPEELQGRFRIDDWDADSYLRSDQLDEGLKLDHLADEFDEWERASILWLDMLRCNIEYSLGLSRIGADAREAVGRIEKEIRAQIAKEKIRGVRTE